MYSYAIYVSHARGVNFITGRNIYREKRYTHITPSLDLQNFKLINTLKDRYRVFETLTFSKKISCIID